MGIVNVVGSSISRETDAGQRVLVPLLRAIAADSQGWPAMRNTKRKAVVWIFLPNTRP
jgi:hypothetical protein